MMNKIRNWLSFSGKVFECKVIVEDKIICHDSLTFTFLPVNKKKIFELNYSSYSNE